MRKHLAIEKKIEDLRQRTASLLRESAFLRSSPNCSIDQVISLQEQAQICEKQADALSWVLQKRSTL